MTNPAKPPLTPAEDKQWAFLAHCGGVLGCIPSALIYKFMAGRGPFTAQESLEALNFTLPPTILALALNIIALVVGIFSPSVGTVFSMLALIVWVFLTVWSVIAAIQVSRGNPYRYPWNLRRIQ
ncbi:DUF4870 domain-containing protein [Arthrobacter sp. SDTb3-6]|nr:DUF4870 domain-containing protein [Arthrobacter sp. SDTb3-6]NVM97953.1 DUF4870 domain-containing protein [Arthrobacter sp. SDTb3-6]